MKKFLFLNLVLPCSIPFILHAQGTRNLVIVEMGTGTWCQACPGGALGADDLYDSGASVGIVEYHFDDDYSTTATHDRISYLGIHAYPTAIFDGANPLTGGAIYTSLYPAYLPRYQAALAAPTPFNTSAAWLQNGNAIDVAFTIHQVGAYSGTGLRMQALLTESHIAHNWMVLDEVNFVCRSMHPDANGTPITIAQGDSITQHFSMAIDAAWDPAHLRLLIWLEDSLTHEIFNGNSLSLAAPTATAPPAPGDWAVHPNPSQGIFTLHSPQGGNEQATLSICDLQGHILLSHPIAAHDHTMDLTAFPPGIYLLQLQSARGRWQQKLIKL